MSEIWLRARFLAHSFHYRMPDTVAISAVNPAVPSPLTVQMAMLAAYLREGERGKAQALLELLPLKVQVRPPQGAVIYRGIMRYVRPPKDAGDLDKNTGAGYKISPHFREFALLDGPLEVYVLAPAERREIVVEALERIPYLGAKDSLVSCLGVEEVSGPPPDCAVLLEDADVTRVADYVVLQLADFGAREHLFPPPKGKQKAQDKALTLERLLPSQRLKEHYRLNTYLVEGRVYSSGNVKIFRRSGRD
ncbi:MULTISPECIES: hypothetical protein [unclassified Meiothermus]|uniref:hypothetical protein n=1 Tax=unclassified Meiothermus TaxID=370471 RepID=UPI000D7BA4EA|nr:MULTISPECIES: hypothetical protein [unclassified Meiothermus]PZA06221.1 hypothetical protein DNA98_14770 [Meiothermus sp. Pnk-1]RYM37445.1 hypothetical protein EWH23_05955 [Meiothermus sp. PNK-Is4]